MECHNIRCDEQILPRGMGYYYNLARGTMEIVPLRAILSRLRGALSCLRDALDRRSRRPEGRIMLPKGGTM